MNITCPRCRFSKDVPLSDIPPSTVNATCPKCDHQFALRGDLDSNGVRSSCARGNDPGGDDQSQPSEQVFLINSTRGVPWELRSDFGFWPGFLLTVVRSLFAPGSFFQGIPHQNTIKPALTFVLFLVLFQTGMQFLWDLSGLIPLLKGIDPPTDGQRYPFWPPAFHSLLPWIFIIIPLALSGAMRVILPLLGTRAMPIKTTLRGLLYGSTPSLAMIIPIIGFWIALFWCLGTWTLGIKEIHRVSYVKSICAMAVAFFILAGLGYGIIRFVPPLIHGIPFV